MSLIDVVRLGQIAEEEFTDIVQQIIVPDLNELRIFLVDGSFVDVWYSLKLEGRYSYHWERKALDGTIYRHNNTPHRRWRNLSTFPKHFHDASEKKVTESEISEIPEEGFRQFLSFVRARLKSLQEEG